MHIKINIFKNYFYILTKIHKFSKLSVSEKLIFFVKFDSLHIRRFPFPCYRKLLYCSPVSCPVSVSPSGSSNAFS